MEIGTVHIHRHWHFVLTEKHIWRKDGGSPIEILTWTSACYVCGRWFKQTSGREGLARVTRTCLEHRRQRPYYTRRRGKAA